MFTSAQDNIPLNISFPTGGLQSYGIDGGAGQGIFGIAIADTTYVIGYALKAGYNMRWLCIGH